MTSAVLDVVNGESLERDGVMRGTGVIGKMKENRGVT